MQPSIINLHLYIASQCHVERVGKHRRMRLLLPALARAARSLFVLATLGGDFTRGSLGLVPRIRAAWRGAYRRLGRRRTSTWPLTYTHLKAGSKKNQTGFYVVSPPPPPFGCGRRDAPRRGSAA